MGDCTHPGRGRKGLKFCSASDEALESGEDFLLNDFLAKGFVREKREAGDGRANT